MDSEMTERADQQIRTIDDAVKRLELSRIAIERDTTEFNNWAGKLTCELHAWHFEHVNAIAVLRDARKFLKEIVSKT